MGRQEGRPGGAAARWVDRVAGSDGGWVGLREDRMRRATGWKGASAPRTTGSDDGTDDRGVGPTDYRVLRWVGLTHDGVGRRVGPTDDRVGRCVGRTDSRDDPTDDRSNALLTPPGVRQATYLIG